MPPSSRETRTIDGAQTSVEVLIAGDTSYELGNEGREILRLSLDLDRILPLPLHERAS